MTKDRLLKYAFGEPAELLKDSMFGSSSNVTSSLKIFDMCLNKGGFWET